MERRGKAGRALEYEGEWAKENAEKGRIRVSGQLSFDFASSLNEESLY